MKKNTVRQYAQSLYEITKKASSDELPEITKQFLTLLVRHRQLKKFEYIIKEFEQYAKEQEGIQEITVESAHELKAENLKNIKSIFDAKKTEIKNVINPAIIGGIRLVSRDIIYDATIKSQLRQLKEHLSK